MAKEIARLGGDRLEPRRSGGGLPQRLDRRRIGIMGEDRHGLGKSQGKRADTAEQIRHAAGAVAGGAHPAGELDLPLLGCLEKGLGAAAPRRRGPCGPPADDAAPAVAIEGEPRQVVLVGS